MGTKEFQRELLRKDARTAASRLRSANRPAGEFDLARTFRDALAGGAPRPLTHDGASSDSAAACMTIAWPMPFK